MGSSRDGAHPEEETSICTLHFLTSWSPGIAVKLFSTRPYYEIVRSPRRYKMTSRLCWKWDGEPPRLILAKRRQPLRRRHVALRPASFDSRMSAFSPVDVPRLLVHSPASPLAMEPPPHATDSRLLTVPSPDYRKISCESPKASDYITMGLAPAILGQLTAIASTMMTPSTMEEVKPPPIQTMDCSASLEHITSSSLDLPLPPNVGQEQVPYYTTEIIQLPQASAELLAQMPAKSVIQDDIRSGNGRFQLVRKRGRSEVWNLFGQNVVITAYKYFQVLDTLTNVRLPYVACYACKVWYSSSFLVYCTSYNDELS
ncbi:unnamed protein product [Heligmosomoides polygyrus]|uniref:Flocculation protein FLO11-like n=1 Tax=Heligmosomoides polygyrus TaxID=6339 RepID=A0A3P8BBV0_HELPZ|nr:unnamed protein product [Heligmosomoides polygyrus]